MDAVSCSLSSLGDVFVMAAELCMCVDFQHGTIWSLNAVWECVRTIDSCVCLYGVFFELNILLRLK